MLVLTFSGCASVQTTTAPQSSIVQAESLTIGAVQRSIKVGSLDAEVIEALGSPNIITTDSDRREVWVYDRISNERIHSSTSGSGGALVVIPFVAAGGRNTNDSSSTVTSQRTLTVIIRFDENKKVRDYSFRASRY